MNIYRGVSVVPDNISLPSSSHFWDDVLLPSIVLGTAKIRRKLARDVVPNALNIGFEAVGTALTYENEDKRSVAHSRPALFIVKIPTRATSPEEGLQQFETSLSNLKCRSADLLLLLWSSDVLAASKLPARLVLGARGHLDIAFLPYE